VRGVQDRDRARAKDALEFIALVFPATTSLTMSSTVP